MDVKRWQLKGFIPGVEGESKAVLKPWVVLAEDFDRVTAERDALQQLLNARDEEIDRLRPALSTLRNHTGVSGNQIDMIDSSLEGQA